MSDEFMNWIQDQVKLTQKRISELERKVSNPEYWEYMFMPHIIKLGKEISKLKEEVNDNTIFKHKYIPKVMKLELVLKESAEFLYQCSIDPKQDYGGFAQYILEKLSEGK